MEVILLERVEKLGQMGDVVNVKPGFARNYLLPQRKALRATKENRGTFDTQRAQLETVNIERRQEAESVAGKMKGLSVVIVRQASDSDQLYGSVTTRDIADGVTTAGFTVDKRQVQLSRPIKTVALHPVRVVLHPEVSVTVTVNVARSEEEAEMQARGERIRDANDDFDDEAEIAAAEAAKLFEEGRVSEEDLAIDESADAPETEAAPDAPTLEAAPEATEAEEPRS